MSLKVILMSAALLLSPFSTTAGKQEHDDWVKFTSPEATFSVLLPHQPTLEVVSDSADGKSTHNRFSHYEKEYFFMLEYFDNVGSIDAKYLDGVRDGFLNTTKGTLLKESALNLEGNSGREIQAEITAGNGQKFIATTRFYLVGQHLYTVSYVRRTEMATEISDQIRNKYFSSFALIKK